MNLFKSFLCLLLWAPLITCAQKTIATDAVAIFTVKTPIRDIRGENRHAVIELDLKTGAVKSHMQVDSFRFPESFSSDKMNTIIRDRFREYYMESSRYPVMSFEGKITNPDKNGYKADGAYPLDISGYMTIHGIKQPVSVQAVLTVKGSKRSLVSDFTVEPESYKVKMPNHNANLDPRPGKVDIRISAEL